MPTDMCDTPSRVSSVLGRLLKATQVDENAQLGITPRWDSLNHIRIILALEQEFGVKVGVQNAPKLTSFKKIVRFLHEKGR
jgi:acyl carrier protein